MLVLLLLLAAPALAGPPGPEVSFSWSPATAPEGKHAPRRVPFRGQHALRFESGRQSRVAASAEQTHYIDQMQRLSLAAVVQLARAPRSKCAIVSRWHTVDGGRSFELGLHPSRQLFFAISSTGKYDKGARELKSDVKLRVGKPYHVVAVFEPGKRMAVYVNGHVAIESRHRIPTGMHLSKAPCLVGNRPGAEAACGFDGIILSAHLMGWPLDRKWAEGKAKELKMTDAPESPYGDDEKLPPCRAITTGPKFHWFGYYDKLQFDPTGRYALSMQTDFEGRSPTAADVIQVGMVDLQDGDRWIELGTSRAWCWQQGCMLQWRPGSKTEVLWNDRQGGRFVCHILDVKTGKKRTIPWPVYALSPDGRSAVTPDFRRVQDMRPGYGYPGLPDPNKDVLAPADSGIWRVDLETGEAKLIVSVADIAKIPYEHGDLAPMKHYFNHLLVNTDGTRFEFLHRWRGPGVRSFGTRMITAKMDGSDAYVLDPHGRTSHFIWRDPTHITAWSWHPKLGSGFILYKDKTQEVALVGKGVMTINGHNTYLPGNQWILNDTYPDGQRNQNPYLYHVATGKRVWLGHFHSPRQYGGEWRCDTHPRFSPDGKLVCIDGVHGGNGRQLYLIDIADIVANPQGKK
ncbi:MAG: hypothetical protein ISS72_09785 [Candidatus Brocadiae bacterium]|nr:hypothetical protein [Candidatus Brocadiia bacterium]